MSRTGKTSGGMLGLAMLTLIASTASATNNEGIAFSRSDSAGKMKIVNDFHPARLSSEKKPVFSNQIEKEPVDALGVFTQQQDPVTSVTMTSASYGATETEICSVQDQGGATNCSVVNDYRWKCSSMQGWSECSIGKDNSGYVCTTASQQNMENKCSTASNDAQDKLACSVVVNSGAEAQLCSVADKDGINGYCSVLDKNAAACSTTNASNNKCSVLHNDNKDPNTVSCSVLQQGECSTHRQPGGLGGDTCSVIDFDYPANCSVSGVPDIGGTPGKCSTFTDRDNAFCSISGEGKEGEHAFCSVSKAGGNSQRCSVFRPDDSNGGKCSTDGHNGGKRFCSVIYEPNGQGECTTFTQSGNDRCSTYSADQNNEEAACSVLNPDSGEWEGPDENGFCSAGDQPGSVTGPSGQQASIRNDSHFLPSRTSRNQAKLFLAAIALIGFGLIVSFSGKSRNS